MKVMVDGKEIKVENDVRIIYDDIIYGMDDDDSDMIGELHVILNCEGMVLDMISNAGDVMATNSQTYGEMADSTI